MPAIFDLEGVRQRSCGGLSVTSAAITGYDGDLGVIQQPGGDGGNLPVRQELHDTPPLKVADDRSVTVVPPKYEVVDADYRLRPHPLPCPAPDHPKQRAIAN